MKLTHVRLLVDDVPGTVAFYRDSLGFDLRADHGGYVELATGEVVPAVFNRAAQQETVELRPGGDGTLLELNQDIEWGDA